MLPLSCPREDTSPLRASLQRPHPHPIPTSLTQARDCVSQLVLGQSCMQHSLPASPFQVSGFTTGQGFYLTVISIYPCPLHLLLLVQWLHQAGSHSAMSPFQAAVFSLPDHYSRLLRTLLLHPLLNPTLPG